MRGLRHLVMTTLPVFGLVAALAAAPAIAADPAAAQQSERLTELRGALAEVNAANQLDFELGQIEIWAPMTGFARAYGNRIEISPIALDLFADRAGARALAAFLVAYVGGEPRPARQGPGVAENIAAAGAVLAGMALDPGKPRDFNLFDWQDQPRSGGGVASGARMLALLEKAHGCSGPLVALLGKAARVKAGDPATAQLVYLARQANRDLGRTAYPPDFSCTAGA